MMVIALLWLFSARILWLACCRQLQTIHMHGSETMCILYWECGVLHLPTERQRTLMKTELKLMNWSRWVGIALLCQLCNTAMNFVSPFACDTLVFCQKRSTDYETINDNAFLNKQIMFKW